ncbi:MAG: CubicO group peptidase (beta-lactamase class C family) [Candidatus Azotimanducaceae bacterium]|jgi:CubicO group peptidase (beta-lactamase class C family)
MIRIFIPYLVVFLFSAFSLATAQAGPRSCDALPAAVDLNFDTDQQQSLEDLLVEMIEKKIAPGAVMLIEHKGKLVFSHTVGMADIERARPLQSDALFRIYSMTKAITSVVAMRLVEQGKLKLNDPISLYIPSFSNAQVWAGDDAGETTEPLERPIIVADLLRHSAGFTYFNPAGDAISRLYRSKGIPGGPNADAPPTDGSPPVNSLQMLADRVASTPLLNQPGERFSYGNASDVLGRIVEIASGQTLDNLVLNEVTRPLGMQDTGFTIPPGAKSRLSNNYAAKPQPGNGPAVLTTPHHKDLKMGQLALIDDARNSVYQHQTIQYGGAGLISTAQDYLRFTTEIRRAAAGKPSKLINAKSIQQMRTNQLDQNARDSSVMLGGLGFGYGFAVRIAPTQDEPVFPECGLFWGGASSTYFWIDPANNVSGVLMTQVFGGDVKSYWMAALKSIYANK